MKKFSVVKVLVFVLALGLWTGTSPALAQSVKEKAEAEGKLMFYATFNAADSKMLTDGFKLAYP